MMAPEVQPQLWCFHFLPNYFPIYKIGQVTAKQFIVLVPQVKLHDIAEPVVGLEFVDEFLPLIDDEVEPYYEVTLRAYSWYSEFSIMDFLAISFPSAISW